MEVLTIEQIKSKYPNQWVLVGNPELTDPSILGSIASKLVSGVVLLSSTDKREIGYRAKYVKAGYDTITCIYTGEIPQKRNWPFWGSANLAKGLDQKNIRDLAYE